jgi:hypothetical protein
MDGTINITGNFTEEGAISASGTMTINSIDDQMFQSVELDDEDNNFHIQNSYSYGDITECFLLIFIAGVLFWNLILKATSKKNDF